MWQTLWQSIMDLFIDCKSICIVPTQAKPLVTTISTSMEQQYEAICESINFSFHNIPISELIG